jgi:hypothetical protein
MIALITMNHHDFVAHHFFYHSMRRPMSVFHQPVQRLLEINDIQAFFKEEALVSFGDLPVC